MTLFRNSLTAVLFVSGLIIAGCSSSPNSSSGGSVKLSVKGIGNAGGSGAQALQVNAATVTITSVRIVIDKVELKSNLGDTLDFKLKQPFVKDLMITSGAQVIQTAQIPAGTYKELEIEIDELKPEDGTVYTANPDLRNLSVLVKGFVNTPTDTFAFASDLEEEQEQEFEPPIVIDANSPATNIVLTLNLDVWFVDENGAFLDPRLPENKSEIERNIKNSIDAFEDKDDDGEKDDD